MLGGSLLHLPALDEAMEILEPNHFWSPKNQSLWAVLRDMRNSGRGDIDAVTVSEFAEKRGKLDAAGGPGHIVECLSAVPHSAHTASYARVVLEKAKRRSAQSAAIEMLSSLDDPTTDTDELLTRAEESLHLAIDAGTIEGPQSIGEIITEALGEISAGTAAKRMVSTGFQNLDDMVGGCPRGGVTIVAARPSAGKTALACSVAIRMAEQGSPVLFSSYEQPIIELAERMLAVHSGVSFYSLRKNLLTKQDNEAVLNSAAQLGALPITLDVSCSNQTRLQALIRAQCRRKKVAVAIVDYLQLIEPEDRKANREQQVAGCSRALKRTAMATGCSLIVLSQLNRDVEKRDTKRPRLSDLRESGAIEQDADQVWLLHRPNSDSVEPGRLDDYGVLEVAKNRNGARGDVQLNWHAPSMRYSPCVSQVSDHFD